MVVARDEDDYPGLGATLVTILRRDRCFGDTPKRSPSDAPLYEFLYGFLKREAGMIVSAKVTLRIRASATRCTRHSLLPPRMALVGRVRGRFVRMASSPGSMSIRRHGACEKILRIDGRSCGKLITPAPDNSPCQGALDRVLAELGAVRGNDETRLRVRGERGRNAISGTKSRWKRSLELKLLRSTRASKRWRASSRWHAAI